VSNILEGTEEIEENGSYDNYEGNSLSLLRFTFAGPRKERKFQGERGHVGECKKAMLSK